MKTCFQIAECSLSYAKIQHLFYLIILLVFHFFIRMNIDMEWNSRGSKENMRLSSSSSSLKAKLYKASCKNRFEK